MSSSAPEVQIHGVLLPTATCSAPAWATGKGGVGPSVLKCSDDQSDNTGGNEAQAVQASSPLSLYSA